jgi:uncharacterized protein YabN with tetrapyrrole methylase and pyrophosphatase domain
MMKRKKNSFDIALAGIGIGGFEQTTLETLEIFKAARIIFHLTEYHQILRKYCKHVVNLDKEYWIGDEDWKIYKKIANMILDEAKSGPGVVAVGDGHPAYYDDVTWDVYRRGKRRGLNVRIIPAISCIDAMAANCGLEINTSGLQIFDASVMVAAQQKLNPYVDTLIMQIGWFGTALVLDFAHSKKGRFEPVIRHLTKFYPETHPVKIMRAPSERSDSPTVITTKLSSLDRFHKTIFQGMCLFIPALESESDSEFEAFYEAAADKDHVLKLVAL